MSFNGLFSCKSSLGHVALAFPCSSVGWTITHQKLSCRSVVSRAMQCGQSVSSVRSPRSASKRGHRRELSGKRNVGLEFRVCNVSVLVVDLCGWVALPLDL